MIALRYLIKIKMVKLCRVGGQFEIKDGRIWNKDTLYYAVELANEMKPTQHKES